MSLGLLKFRNNNCFILSIMNLHRLLPLLITLFLTVEVLAQDIQWADRLIKYSSQYGEKAYGANQVLGSPKVIEHKESKVAWMPSMPNRGSEFIQVSFKNPIKTKQILICENYNPGAITQVFAYDKEGKEYLLFSQKDGKNASKGLNTFTIDFSETKYAIAQVKVVLNTTLVGGYNQIDAIGISSKKNKFRPSINNIRNDQYVGKAENMGYNLNSAYDDMLPIVAPDGKSIFFARKKSPENIGSKKQDDIYYSVKGKKGWLEAVNIGSPLNNEYHNFVCAISPDGNTIYVSGSYEKNSDKKGVSVSTRKDDQSDWSTPKRLKIAGYYNKNKYACYHISPDGKIMVLAIERDDSKGDLDLYMSKLIGKNSWSTPKNLGTTINTAGTEASIFLAADGKTIYFSSDGHAGYGGLDMFMSKRLDNTWSNWSEPVNLGEKINTNGWDVYYTIAASGEYAYFARENGTYGKHDLYKIKLPKELRPEPVTMITANFIAPKTSPDLPPKPQNKTVILSKEETPVKLYENVKGYFPIEQETKEEEAQKAALEEDDDFKEITLKDGIVIPESEADKTLNDLKAKLQKLKKDQAATKNAIEKYDPSASTPSYQPRYDPKKSKNSNKEDGALAALDAKLAKLKSEKDRLTAARYVEPTRITNRPEKIYELREEETTAFQEKHPEYKSKLEQLIAERDGKSFHDTPEKNLKKIKYDSNNDKIKYKEKDKTVDPSKIENDPEVQSYQEKLAALKEKYNNAETNDKVPTTKDQNDDKKYVVSPTFEKKVAKRSKPNNIETERKENKPDEQKALNSNEQITIDKTEEKIDPVLPSKQERNYQKVDDSKERAAKKLEEEVSQLEKEKLALLEDKDLIEAEKSVLEQDKASLSSEKETLQNEKENLEEEKKALDKLITDLENERSALAKAKQALEDQRLRLENLKRKQKNEITQLEQEINQLQQTKGAIQNEVVQAKKEEEAYKEVQKDIFLMPLKVGTVFEIKNIYFDVNSAFIKAESYDELNKVTAFLKVNENISIEIGGHTNGLCTSSVCNALSGNRAKAVTEYIAAQGVEANRLSYKGYGKTKPIASNDTPTGRKKNQRVELKILSID